MNTAAARELVLREAERPPGVLDFLTETAYCFTNHCTAEYAADRFPMSRAKASDRMPRPESVLEGFGERLKEVRGTRTQDEFARMLGMPRQQLTRYESGRVPDPLVLVKIALTTGASLDWLLGGVIPGVSAAERAQSGMARYAQGQGHLPQSSALTSEEMVEQGRLWNQVNRVFLAAKRRDETAQKLVEGITAMLSAWERVQPPAEPRTATGAAGM